MCAVPVIREKHSAQVTLAFPQFMPWIVNVLALSLYTFIMLNFFLAL